MSLNHEGEETRKWICVWISEIGHASWKLPADLVAQYPTALVSAENTFLFCVCGSRTFLELKVAFSQGIAVITAIVNKS